MPDARAILRRFRPAAAPGAAALGGVPADRVAEREAELAEVFALLQDVEEECARLLEAARAAAESQRSAARSRSEGLLAEGRRRADAERMDAAAAVGREARREAEEALDDARREAERIASTAASRMPRLVDAAAERMRARLGDADGSTRTARAGS
jgi:vacuolar-type H+-ATPase subunit H